MKVRTAQLILIIAGLSIMILPLALFLGESPKEMGIVILVAVGADVVATLAIIMGMNWMTGRRAVL